MPAESCIPPLHWSVPILLPELNLLPGFRVLPHLLFASLAAFVAFSPSLRAASRLQAAPVPDEMRSYFFAITVNGSRVDVAQAAANYEFANFDVIGPAEITITAAERGFWDHGVDIQPWRLGLHATRNGQTIRFRINGPAKLSVSRPDDFLNRARMLFLFAGAPPPPPPTGPDVTVIPAGPHRQSLNPKSGETIYLEPGAFIYGSLNLWNVENVKIMGRGTIVYDGPQAPNADEGWMQKPDWHCIGAYQARHVEIDGLTCVIRSRTWSIQMKDSTGFTYDDLRVVGGNPGNANQDGMDWLGSGDAVVRNSFFRASDDDLAMEGNWDGYTQDDMLRPGKDVRNILVENTELSTSISNIVRAGWPQKIFNSSNFTLRNSDILHAGIGACGQTFGLIGFWGAKDAQGDHQGFLFENLFLDNWYSLAQLEQEQPSLKKFEFRNIWALGQPPLAGSTITGDVSGVVFDNVKYGQTRVDSDAALPLTVSGGAQQPQFIATHTPNAMFRVVPATATPGKSIEFTALPAANMRYTWLFGDGTVAHGRSVRHRFIDALGTQLDGANGAGRYRVLLHVEDKTGHQDWAEQDVVVADRFEPAATDAAATQPGLAYGIYPGEWTELPDFPALKPVESGQSTGLDANSQGFTRYAVAWDGFIDVPKDGGYNFYLLDPDGARLVIDGREVAKTGPPFAQVCGSPGNAVRFAVGSLGLRSGKHSIHIEGLYSVSNQAPRLMWQAQGAALVDVPANAYSRDAK
jgi:hypothetical protein